MTTVWFKTCQTSPLVHAFSFSFLRHYLQGLSGINVFQTTGLNELFDIKFEQEKNGGCLC